MTYQHQDYPRWLYSKDHGSVIVDTPADAFSLPNTDWYSMPDFSGEVVVGAIQVEIPPKLPDVEATLQQMVANAEELGLYEPPPVDDVFVAVGATRFSDGEKQTAQSLDKSTKAYKNAQKGPVL